MDFESMRRRYSAWRLLCISGDISYEEFARRLEQMVGTDAAGRRWRINPDSGGWLRQEGNRWVEDVPFEEAADADPLPEPPAPVESLSPGGGRPVEGQPSLIRWLTLNWGWGLVMIAGLVLIAAAVVFLVSLGVPSGPGQAARQASGTSIPAPPASATAAPVDIQPPAEPTVGPTSTPAAQIEDARGHIMVLVPAGPFRMGTTEEELTDLYALCNPILGETRCRTLGFEAELPAHDVPLSSYYIDVYEVTNSQYAAMLTVMGNQSGGSVQWYEAGDPQARIAFAADQWQAQPAYADHPATEVTWYGAEAYCEWRGGRLPTEAEWEKAARWDPASGNVRLYPWGSTQPLASQANFGVTNTGTRPVGSYEEGRSPLGLYDMAGNVFEWVSDWHSPNYTRFLDQPDPTGAESGTQRVVRGGSWGDNAFLLRAANRGALPPTSALNFVGFRCVLPTHAAP